MITGKGRLDLNIWPETLHQATVTEDIILIT